MINTDLQETIQIRFIQIDCGTIITQKKVKKYNKIPHDQPNQTIFQIKVPKH